MTLLLLRISAASDFVRLAPIEMSALAMRTCVAHLREGLSGVVLLRMCLELWLDEGLHLLR